MILRQLVLRHGRRTLLRPTLPPLTRLLSTTIDSIASSADNTSKQINNLEAQINSYASPHVSAQTAASAPPAANPIAEEYYAFREQKKYLDSFGSKLEPHYQPHTLLNNPPSVADLTLELLLASEAHQGHATSLWNPANARYIHGVRQGIHIISLELTAAHLRRAAKVVSEVSRLGGIVLFVGTRQGQEMTVVRAAQLAKGYHLFERWIPGSITNGQQILGRCKTKVVNDKDEELPGFDEQLYDRPVLRPDLVVCLNPLENYVLLHECALNEIPTIGVIDTNADPTWVTYPIPANDDSLRCIQVIAGVLGRAGESGQKKRLEAAAKGIVTYQRATGLRLPDEPEEKKPKRKARADSEELQTRSAPEEDITAISAEALASIQGSLKDAESEVSHLDSILQETVVETETGKVAGPSHDRDLEGLESALKRAIEAKSKVHVELQQTVARRQPKSSKTQTGEAAGAGGKPDLVQLQSALARVAEARSKAQAELQQAVSQQQPESSEAETRSAGEQQRGLNFAQLQKELDQVTDLTSKSKAELQEILSQVRTSSSTQVAAEDDAQIVQSSIASSVRSPSETVAEVQPENIAGSGPKTTDTPKPSAINTGSAGTPVPPEVPSYIPKVRSVQDSTEVPTGGVQSPIMARYAVSSDQVPKVPKIQNEVQSETQSTEAAIPPSRPTTEIPPQPIPAQEPQAQDPTVSSRADTATTSSPPQGFIDDAASEPITAAESEVPPEQQVDEVLRDEKGLEDAEELEGQLEEANNRKSEGRGTRGIGKRS